MEKELKEKLKEDKAKKDKELQKEIDDIFSTEDIEDRIKKFNKYHPNDDRFKGEIVYEK